MFNDFISNKHFATTVSTIYATDFISLQEEEKQKMLAAAYKVFSIKNLKINEDTTGQTIIERGERIIEKWRHEKKVGSLIGDSGDILRRR